MSEVIQQQRAARICQRTIQYLAKSGWWLNTSGLREFNELIKQQGKPTPIKVKTSPIGDNRLFIVDWTGPRFSGSAVLATYQVRTVFGMTDPGLKSITTAGEVLFLIVDDYSDATFQHLRECVEDWQDHLSVVEQAKQVEIETIARQLSGHGGAIFRYLASKSNGATFQEFSAPKVNGTRLTESDNVDSIASMLRRRSTELTKHKFQITVSIPKNLIKLKQRK